MPPGKRGGLLHFGLVVAILAIGIYLVGFGTSVALVVILLAIALFLGVAVVLRIGKHHTDVV